MKTVFLDRDGVINVSLPDKGYVRTWADFTFIRNAKEAIRHLTESGFRIIVITNQAGIGRGIVSERHLMDIHHRMSTEITTAGGHLDAIYYCPHRPEVGCACRKPKPGMLLRAAQDHDIDLSKAYFVGDFITDIEAGRSAGVSPLLVLTGHGQDTYRRYISDTQPPKTQTPDKIFQNLYAAAHWLTAVN